MCPPHFSSRRPCTRPKSHAQHSPQPNPDPPPPRPTSRPAARARGRTYRTAVSFTPYISTTHFNFCFCFYCLALAHSSSARLVTACSGRCNGQCFPPDASSQPCRLACRSAAIVGARPLALLLFLRARDHHVCCAVRRHQRCIVRLLRLRVTRVCCRRVSSAKTTSTPRRESATWGWCRTTSSPTPPVFM